MSTLKLAPMGGQTPDIVLTAAQSISVYSQGRCSIQLIQVSPNQPSANVDVASQLTAGILTYSPGAAVTVRVTGGPLYETFYTYGVASGNTLQNVGYRLQPNPGTLNATGTLTAALILSGIVTSTTAAAVTATLDTGTVMDTSLIDATLNLNDSFIWSAINTGGANAFTVTASAGHTIVGSGTVAASSSARFQTRRTAANTWITYRLT